MRWRCNHFCCFSIGIESPCFRKSSPTKDAPTYTKPPRTCLLRASSDNLSQNLFFNAKPIASPLLRTLLRTFAQNPPQNILRTLLEACVVVRPPRRVCRARISLRNPIFRCPPLRSPLLGPPDISWWEYQPRKKNINPKFPADTLLAPLPFLAPRTPSSPPPSRKN